MMMDIMNNRIRINLPTLAYLYSDPYLYNGPYLYSSPYRKIGRTSC